MPLLGYSRDASPSDLVRQLLADPCGPVLFKDIGARLEECAPDANVVPILDQAYREGRAQPWLTAYLLRSLRHESGYALAREILWAEPGNLAESYAATAMARMKGKQALPDLIEALHNAKRIRAREGAAYGICELGDESLVSVLLEAARAKRIRKRCPAGLVASLPRAEERLLEWLASDDKVRQEVALYACFSLCASGSLRNALLVQAIDRALQSQLVPIAPHLRRMLEERIRALV
jgi:hypothetical protein